MTQGALGWHSQVLVVGDYRRGSCEVPEVSPGSSRAGAARGEAEWPLQPLQVQDGAGIRPPAACGEDSLGNISNISFPREGALLQQGEDEEEEEAETVNV